jgi:DNA-directed RNA polymerase subunit RPC12/RpoP
MTCAKCGGKIIVDKKSGSLDIEGDNLNIELVGECEDCGHQILVGCEGTMEYLGNYSKER